MSSSREQTSFLLRYVVQSLAIILLVAILLRSFVFSSYAVSGSSMLPAIWPGDFLLGSRIRLKEIRRGDVVALRCPLVRDQLCLKRVVGLPGDRLEFRGGGLVLNGQMARYMPSGVFQTEFAGGGAWAVWPEGTLAAGMPKGGPVVVPPSNVYLLNDKRSDHDDSRTWGPISQDFIEARVIRVWMSLDWYDRDHHVRTWPRLRWPRLLRGID